MNPAPTASFEKLLEDYSRALAPLGRGLLELADRDRFSPAYGCFFYPYWRSKSEDFANARCQEAVYSLALLYLRDYPGNTLRGRAEVLELARAGMLFWARLQHRDGSFDEWYRGEHGFAATAFSAFAIARAFSLLKEDIPAAEEAAVAASLARAGRWLSGRDDLAKLNHEAVAAAALFSLAEVLGEPGLEKAAAEKMGRVLSRQTTEGWFPELGGIDTGYCFLTVEYLCHCLEFYSGPRLREALARALDFLLVFVHPDITTGPEYNLCRNSYVSLAAAGAMSSFHAGARRLFLDGVSSSTMLRQLVQDDLSRCYHLYNGLLAYDCALQSRKYFSETAPALPCRGPVFARYFPQAGLLARRTRFYYLVISVLNGGGLKLFPSSSRDTTVSDWGYALGDGEKRWWRSSASIEPEDLEFGDGTLKINGRFARISYFFPGRLPRLLLGLAGLLPGAWALVKWATDKFRTRKRASLQLSSVSSSGWKGEVRRRMRFFEDRVELYDVIEPARSSPVSFLRVEVEERRGGVVVGRPLSGLEEELLRRVSGSGPVEVKKAYAAGPAGLKVEADLRPPPVSVDRSSGSGP